MKIVLENFDFFEERTFFFSFSFSSVFRFRCSSSSSVFPFTYCWSVERYILRELRERERAITYPPHKTFDPFLPIFLFNHKKKS